MCEYIERQNELMKFEWEKWEVAAKTNSYPINGVAQALYRIYQSQMGDLPIWHEVDGHVRKIMERAVRNKTNTFPNTRHRVIAWSCAPLYYSNWCTWAYNTWGLNVVINMDSLMFDMTIRTDSYENTLEDMAQYHMWAPMRRMAVGGMHHFYLSVRFLYFYVLADNHLRTEVESQSDDKSQAYLTDDFELTVQAFLVLLEYLDVVVGKAQRPQPDCGNQHQYHINIAQFAQ